MRWIRSHFLSILLFVFLIVSASYNYIFYQSTQKSSFPVIQAIPEARKFPTTTIKPSKSLELLPKLTNDPLIPIPTIALVSVCGSLSSSLFPTPKPASTDACRVIELRSRDLLQETYNLHFLLRQIRRGEAPETGPLNKINELNNNLAYLWLHIAGYGLGTDPYLDRQLAFTGTFFSEAKGPPNYGLSGSYGSMGLPRIYNAFIENAQLSPQEIQARETKFLLLVQPYSNPALYPFSEFYMRAYYSYRGGDLLGTPEYKKDLETIDAWLTKLESVLQQIPTFLRS